MDLGGQVPGRLDLCFGHQLEAGDQFEAGGDFADFAAGFDVALAFLGRRAAVDAFGEQERHGGAGPLELVPEGTVPAGEGGGQLAAGDGQVEGEGVDTQSVLGEVEGLQGEDRVGGSPPPAAPTSPVSAAGPGAPLQGAVRAKARAAPEGGWPDSRLAAKAAGQELTGVVGAARWGRPPDRSSPSPRLPQTRRVIVSATDFSTAVEKRESSSVQSWVFSPSVLGLQSLSPGSPSPRSSVPTSPAHTTPASPIILANSAACPAIVSAPGCSSYQSCPRFGCHS